MSEMVSGLNFVLLFLVFCCLIGCKEPGETITYGLGDKINVIFNDDLTDKAFPPSGVVKQDSANFIFRDNITIFDNSRWHSKWDEANVFMAELKHGQSDNPYTLRIGKGGQLYSIMTPVGEIAPPQNPDHAWVDDTYLLVIYQYDLVQPQNQGIEALTPFIHQCGMYPHLDKSFQRGEQFWAPVVARKWDAENDQFSTISLGMISNGPAYNRGDVLMYQRTKDMGNGVFEITYMAYNYNSSYSDSKTNYLTDFGAWGGIRTSKLPVLILSHPDHSWEIANHQFGSAETYAIVKNTGGWAVATENTDKDSSYSLGLVFGNTSNSCIAKMYGSGTTNNERSFTVQSVLYRINLNPGETYYCRQYYILGNLSDVIEKCKTYNSKAESGFLNFNHRAATKIPLFLTEINGQTVISEEGTNPVFYVYAEPVKNSKPLYLIRDTRTYLYHATCDPYHIMPRYPIVGDPLDRKGIRPYDGTTEILKLYGFVLPRNYCDNSINYKSINSVLTDKTFYTKNGIYDKDIMVEVPGN